MLVFPLLFCSYAEDIAVNSNGRDRQETVKGTYASVGIKLVIFTENECPLLIEYALSKIMM
jgi:hypothetical protein